MTEQDKPVPESKAPRQAPSALAVTAIVLSLCALGVSVLEVASIRDEQRMGVWPYVDLSASYNEDGFAIEATNKGIGPARVRYTSLSLDGKPVDSIDAMILALLGPDRAFSYELYRAADPSNSVLSPDETATLFGVPWTPVTRAMVEEIDRVSVELCYCSVYDDCWLAVVNQGDPQAVADCAR